MRGESQTTQNCPEVAATSLNERFGNSQDSIQAHNLKRGSRGGGKRERGRRQWEEQKKKGRERNEIEKKNKKIENLK